MHKFKLLFLFQFCCIIVYAQQSNSSFSRSFSLFSENEIHEIKSDYHTSIKPFLLSNSDSTLQKEKGTWLFRKWNKEHFIQLENEEYSLVVNPILNIMIAK